MNIQITEDRTTKHPGGVYRAVEVDTGGPRVLVILSPFECRVIVQNASHHAYRGSGRGFATLGDAREHYRSDKVQAALATVATLVAEPSQVAS